MRTIFRSILWMGVLWSLSIHNIAAQNESVFAPHHFLRAYSNSLLNGTYIDHANLYADPTYFGGRWHNAASIKKIAKNFYANYRTIKHNFEILNYYYADNGNMEVIVNEYQTVKNRSTGEVTSTMKSKKIQLFYWKAYYCYSQEEIYLE
jgi:hypothetical protein